MTPYTIEEADVMSREYPDGYVREMVEHLLNLIRENNLLPIRLGHMISEIDQARKLLEEANERLSRVIQ